MHGRALGAFLFLGTGRDIFAAMQLEHIGIAVADLKAAREVYTQLLGCEPYKEETVAAQGVRTLFYRTGESKVELLEATGAASPIARHVERRGEGLHHVAFEVADIHAEMQRLRSAGFRLLSEQPGVGADNKLVCFVHPKDAGGVLVELCQSQT